MGAPRWPPSPPTFGAPRPRRGALLYMALIAVVLGSGCAREKWVYEKPHATPAQLDRDTAACRKESVSHQKVGITPEDRVDRPVFNRCMERRGYTPRKLEGRDMAPPNPPAFGGPGVAVALLDHRGAPSPSHRARGFC